MLARVVDGALVGLEFVEGPGEGGAGRDRSGESAGDDSGGMCGGVLDQIEEELAGYFAGRGRGFRTPIAPRGTAFQERVWEVLATIPFGEAWSYARLARRAFPGHHKPCALARAVGQANHRNPIAIVVPCHRVVAADGTLCGYAGGLERKRALLALEGAGLFG